MGNGKGEGNGGTGKERAWRFCLSLSSHSLVGS